jgi:hypothetical protein
MSQPCRSVSPVEPTAGATIQNNPSQARRCGAAVLLVMLSTLLFGQDAQPAPAAGPATAQSAVSDELQQMRQAIAEQQKQIQQQQQQINELRGQLMRAEVPESAKTADPKLVEATMHTSAAPPPEAAQDYEQKPAEDKESPLSVRIGKMEFKPGGFLDFAAVIRGTNVGSGLPTTFGNIPFNNTIFAHISETRLTAQNSRLSLKAHGVFGANDITGYVEMDFLGNSANNVFVTSNSNTDRMRLYWVDLRHGKWEFLGGQSWSWLTPNRVGLSPDPKDVFYTLNEDTNYQVGLTWTRAAQFRVAYHPNEHWGLGVALENPEQFVGTNSPNGTTIVHYPFAFNALLTPQFDAANNSATPNLHPDIIPKVAYDTDFGGGRHFHAEVAGLITTKKITNLDLVPPLFPWTSHTATGANVEFAGNVDLFKKLKLVASGFYGQGGGRYIFGLGPDVVVEANPTAKDLELHLVTSGSGIVGFEAPVTSKTTLAAYYGGAYFDRNAFLDTSAPAGLNPVICTPGSAPSLQPCIGFGGGNSTNLDNRELQEATFDWIQTLWSDRNYGKLQFMTQFSYLTRSPWFIPNGAPKNAHTVMGYIDLRYILP